MESYDFILTLIKDAGGLLLKKSKESFEIMTKNNDPRNIVTTVDLGVNNFLINAIKEKFPLHGIYSEEGSGETKQNEYMWAIDPIDGSSNFARHIPHFAICIGLLHKNIPIVGAVYNPITQELFSFKKGRGAYLNGEPISVSPVSDLSRAYVFLHAGRKKELWNWGGASYRKLLERTRKVSNFSGSGLDACFVAAGRIEANIYGQVTTLDIAGAIGILLEAGGRVVDSNGKPVTLSKTPTKVIMTNNDEIKKAILKII